LGLRERCGSIAIMTESARKLLIVEDDPGIQSQLRWCFEDYEVIAATDRATAIAELRRHEPAVVLQDLGLPPDDSGVTEGFATLREILKLAPFTKVVVVTGHGDQSNAVKAVGLGAYDFYQKPVDVDTLQLIVQRAYQIHTLEAENRQLAEALGSSPLDGVIAASESMLKVCRTIEKVAPTNATTLLQGESGTGKEVLARAVHSLSTRRREAFVAINCAAIPETLLESELFGFEKGAFTGAVKQTQGKIESANRGTLFLDEIGDMPQSLQAKLLRFLQERTIERIGGRAEIPVDVRVVCATNKNLRQAMASGAFREDLYYRISEITIDIPPLREREGGRLLLAQYLLNKFAKQQGRSIKGFTEDAHDALEAYAWPGNVREMENKIKAAVIMAESKFVTAVDLGLTVTVNPPSLNLRVVRQNAETHAIRQALVRAGGNISRTAELLGVTRPTLYDLMAKYGISAADADVPAPEPTADARK
jgi:two-component system NtrC family response regulator